MALDWGLYSAFRTQPRLEQRAQLEAQSIGYLKELNMSKQTEMAAQKQNEMAIREKMAVLDDIKGLDRDKNELMKLAKSEEANIIKGIADSGGDATKYLNTGGMSQLYGYFQNIKNSQEMGKLQKNKEFMASFYDGLSKGERAIPITHRDENGVEQILDFPTAMQMYNNGDLDELAYKGSEKPVEIDPGKVNKIQNPNGMDSRPVKQKEYYGMLLAGGQHPLVAAQMAKEANEDPEGVVQGLWFGERTDMKKALMSARTARAKTRAASAIKRGGKGSEGHKDVYSAYQKGDDMFKSGKFMTNEMTDGSGRKVNVDHLQVGEAAYVDKIEYSRDEGSDFLKTVKNKLGIGNVEPGGTMDFGTGMEFRPIGSGGKTFTLNPDAAKQYKVNSIRPVISTQGALTKTADGGSDKSQLDSKGGFYIQLEMSDDEAKAFTYTDEKGDQKQFYDASLGVWDTPGQGFERFVVETKDDSDIVRMNFIMDAPAGMHIVNEANQATIGSGNEELLPYMNDANAKALAKIESTKQEIEDNPEFYQNMVDMGYDKQQIQREAMKHVDWGLAGAVNTADFNDLTFEE